MHLWIIIYLFTFVLDSHGSQVINAEVKESQTITILEKSSREEKGSNQIFPDHLDPSLSPVFLREKMGFRCIAVCFAGCANYYQQSTTFYSALSLCILNRIFVHDLISLHVYFPSGCTVNNREGTALASHLGTRCRSITVCPQWELVFLSEESSVWRTPANT